MPEEVLASNCSCGIKGGWLFYLFDNGNIQYHTASFQRSEGAELLVLRLVIETLPKETKVLLAEQLLATMQIHNWQVWNSYRTAVGAVRNLVVTLEFENFVSPYLAR